MAAAALAPLLFVAAFVIQMLLEAQRDAATRSVLEAARAISRSLDQELAAGEAVLRVLATSASLANGDLQGFHQQAGAAERTDADAIALYAADGRAILVTSEPLGTPLSRLTDAERIGAVLASEQPKVSTLRRSRDGKQQVLILDVPIRVGDQRYVL